MTRVKPLEPQDVPELEALFASGQKMMGFVSNDGLIMAHRPEILKSFSILVQSIFAPSTIDNGLKRLLGFITSTAAGCTYCQAHTENGARRLDVEEEKIATAWDFEQSPLFSEAERVALRIALRSTMVPNAVTDEDFQELHRHYSEEQIVEIVAVISTYAFLNRWNSTLQTDLEDYFTKDTPSS